MNDEVIDLRKGERFLVLQPAEATFNGVPVTLINVSVSGLQILHEQPLRIGTKATLAFSQAGLHASVPVHVVWSHLSQTDEGLRYKSGVHLQAPSVEFASTLNTLLRCGAIARDTDSLERKRQRELEREQRRKSSPKMSIIPPTS